MYFTWRNIKKSYKNNKSKISHGMKNLNYLTDRILYQTFKVILRLLLKKHEPVTNDLLIGIYVNKIENRVTFRFKSGYYLELLTPETMKSLYALKVR